MATDTIFRNRFIVKNEDLNGFGRLFGGRALSWIDEESAIFCMCQLQTKNIVTKTMSDINFKAPASEGDIVEIGCEVISLGTTSITIKAVMRNKTTMEEILTVDKIVFVCLDKDGRPTPHNKNIKNENHSSAINNKKNIKPEWERDMINKFNF